MVKFHFPFMQTWPGVSFSCIAKVDAAVPYRHILEQVANVLLLTTLNKPESASRFGSHI